MHKRYIFIKYFITFSFCLFGFFSTRVFAQTSKVNALELQLKQSQPDTTRLRLLKQMAEAYTQVDPIKKLYYVNLFKTLAEKLHDEQAIGDAYIQIGISYAQRGKLDTALVFFQTAYGHSAKIKYLSGMGRSLSDIGLVYARLDDAKEAIKYDLRALEILKKMNNKRLINQVIINIGSIYFDLKQYQFAESYFNQCLLNYTAAKDTAGIGYGLFVMGNCFQATGKDEKAKDCFTRSLAIREKLGDLNGIALVKRGLGQVYLHQKQYNLSLTYLNEALKGVKALQDKYEEAAALLDLSDLYLAMNEYDKAAYCAKQALSICKTIGAKAGVPEALERLIDVYKKKGDLKNALQYQSDYIKTQDGVLTAKALKDVTLIEFDRVRTENADLEKSNNLITSKNTSYAQQIDSYANAIIATLVLLLLVVIFVIVLYRQNLQKQMANRQLLLQKQEIANINKELGLLNKEISSQIELTNSQNAELERINNIKNKFFSIISHDLRSPIAALQSLLSIYREGDVDEDELALLLGKLEDTIITTGTFLDNLLEWSKSQMEGIIIKPQNFDLLACFKESIRLFETTIGIKGLHVINQAANPVFVYADKNMINLVIRNLLSNSVKFCNPGDSITLSAVEKGNRVIISISDTGPGISEAGQQRLFSLEHAVSSGTQGEKGNHLGLILCKDMALQNNGTISFETKEGNGTTFWIDIPAAQ
ncbi:signal transduction histidine kinase [Mucilaginibacter gracilis]|uniref:histidine kinase n=1 Tax=Mucilaginibacter gracilis TaxID=423350 RepID=A0A495IY74_9SPHI|nr:tetratricopeptide repeat-containing sensor histidine kinase [Mucilaginibacter gracilis]RKR81453.1 signal transduction histidine kinase [Mucilaginibacter gracilis]